MQSTFKKIPQSQVQVKVQADQKDWQKAEELAARELGKAVRVKGFRPGKAPTAIIKDRIEPKHLAGETLTQLVNLAYQVVLNKHEIRSVGLPKIEIPALKDKGQENALLEMKEKGYLDIWLTFSVWPKVRLGDYPKIVREAKEGKKIETARTLSEAQKKAETAKRQTAEKAGEMLKKTPEEQKQARIEVIMEALRENIQFDLPEVLIEEETRLRMQQSEQNAQKLGLTLKDYLRARGDTLADFEQKVRLGAEEGLRTRLILEEIGKDLGREVEKSEDLRYVVEELLKM